MEELSMAEIAAFMHMPESTVKTRIHRAKKILRERLEREPVTAALLGLISRNCVVAQESPLQSIIIRFFRHFRGRQILIYSQSRAGTQHQQNRQGGGLTVTG